jgi:glycosyltransferase involved in cell wall biosynthesis
MPTEQTLPAVRASVAMATYDGMRYLAEQIDSILASLAPQDELVVVDDASRDGTWAFLQACSDPRVRIHRNPENLGVRRSFERALSMTRYDLVFLADQDDVWETAKRDAMVAAFVADPGVTVVVSDARVIDESGHPVMTSFMATRGGFDGSLIGTLWRNRFLGCAMALRRPVIDAALPIPSTAPMHDMWMGAIGTQLGRVVYLPVPLMGYRRHGGNVSPSRSPSRWQAVRWRIDLLVALVRRLPAVTRERSARKPG